MTASWATFWEVPDEATTPAWLAKRRLADALRAAVELCVTTDAPEAALIDARARVEALTALLAPHPGTSYGDARPLELSDEARLPFLDRNGTVGRSSAISPPIHLGTEGDRSIGLVTFGAQFEGAPGFVHGGFVAAGFDQMFGHVQMRRGVPSMTGSLTVRYRRPTPIRRALRFEAWASRSSGRKHFVEARLLDGELLLADAEALFVEIDFSRGVPGGAPPP